MKEVLLLKYGELALKGLNRGYFEKLLRRELEMRLKLAGNFKVTLAQSTIYVEPTDDDADIDEALRLCRKVFGITTVARAAVAEKAETITAYTVKADGTKTEFVLTLGALTDDERKIILDGCLINYYNN